MPTKKQREKLMKQMSEPPRDKEDDVTKKFLASTKVAIAISKVIAVLVFVLVLGKLCGM